MGLKFTNEKGYSLSIAVWLADDDYDSAPVPGPYISVTSLLKPLRQIILDQRKKAIAAKSGLEESVDLDRFIAARLGTAIHSAIEHSWTRKLKDGTPAYKAAMLSLGYPKKVINKIRINPTSKELDSVKGIIPVFMEQRSYKQVGKWVIGGQFDFCGNGHLEDFKSMGVFGYMKGDKDEEQMMQGSLYRWLNPDIVTADTMKIQQIFTDWSKLDSMTKAKRGYPGSRILEKRLALKAMDDWVNQRIRKIDSMLETPEEQLPACTPEELWQVPSVFKYYGITQKGALSKVAKVSADNYAEVANAKAEAGGVGEIKEIKGKVRRCGYCNGYDLCSQKDHYVNEGILQMP